MKVTVMYRNMENDQKWQTINVNAETVDAATDYVARKYDVIGSENIIAAPFDETTEYNQNRDDVETVDATSNRPELKINGNVEFPSSFTFWNNSPRLIENGNELKSEDTLKDPATVMQLRYMAAELMSSAFSVWNDKVLTRDEIEDECFISGDNLNLANGEGYRIADNLIIDYLFAVNVYGSNRGCLALYDENADDYTYWLIY